jgi:hypothetical protein
MVGPFTAGWSAIANERGLGTAPASAAFTAANKARYYPVLVPVICAVRRLWWANGATVSASYNLDCGIYADAGYAPGTLLVSTGSTAQGTASQVQFVDVTDTALSPGLYWIAIACSSTSATLFRSQAISGAASVNAALSFGQTTALPLPATATPAEATDAEVYLCGFATTSSP